VSNHKKAAELAKGMAAVFVEMAMK